MKKYILTACVLSLMSMAVASCAKTEWDVPSTTELDEGNVTEGLTPLAQNVQKAPLYWSVYENVHDQEDAKRNPITFDMAQWEKTIDWVSTHFLPYGYDMLATDGFCSMIGPDGYMTEYSGVPLKDIVARCKAKGLKLGVYDNPLWIHATNLDAVIPGTDGIKVSSLRFDPEKDKDVISPDTHEDFQWVVTDHPGAREFIDGFFKHYADLDVHFIRMDFMSWYEDGKNYSDQVNKGYGRKRYVQAMKWIAESAHKYGVFVSMVMPHLKNDAAIEKYCGNMMRINADVLGGTWYRFSDNNRGLLRGGWPNSENAFDGFINWSKVSGRGKVILDGDFTPIHGYADANEKMSVISLQLLAGGPIAITDQPETIGDNMSYYQNKEMLALNADGFVGQPMSRGLWDVRSQIWYGQMQDGSWVVGLFNRDNAAAVRSVRFADFGAEGSWKVRDLWTHTDEGQATELSVTIPAHGCKVVRLTR